MQEKMPYVTSEQNAPVTPRSTLYFGCRLQQYGSRVMKRWILNSKHSISLHHRMLLTVILCSDFSDAL